MKDIHVFVGALRRLADHLELHGGAEYESGDMRLNYNTETDRYYTETDRYYEAGKRTPQLVVTDRTIEVVSDLVLKRDPRYVTPRHGLRPIKQGRTFRWDGEHARPVAKGEYYLYSEKPRTVAMAKRALRTPRFIYQVV